MGTVTHLISVNGRVTPAEQAVLPLPDDGLYRGDGVFEVIRVYAGRPFAMAEHLDRMERSAAVIELPVDRGALEAEATSLLDLVGPADHLIRLISTRAGNRLVAVEPLPSHSPSIRLATVTYTPTVILDGVKSLAYAANMQATRLAQASGADEALLVRPDGTVLEAPTSSIFWVSAGGRLRTTALEAGVLDSITRRRIVERLDVEEGRFPLEDLLSAGEAFLASTTREAHPVSAVDSHAFDLASTPAANAARQAFADALAQDGITSNSEF